VYDEKHRLKVVPLSSEERERFEQKGIREYLLCEDCEMQISKYEDHVKRVFYGGTGISIKRGNPIIIGGIDYSKFKLFQLSLIWRASVSKNNFFGAVQLGSHEEKIRKMIISENPGGWLKYPCCIFMMLMDGKEILDAFIYPPQLFKYKGHFAYRFIFGGCFWIFFISSHTHEIEVKNFFLTEDGKISIPLRKAEDTPFFQGVARSICEYTKK